MKRKVAGNLHYYERMTPDLEKSEIERSILSGKE
jgi:hypothetical protein